MFDSEVNSGFTHLEDINISATFTEIELLHASSNGYSEVCRAKRFGKWHILKCLTREAQQLPTYQTLLEKEFAIAYSVSHPNAVRTLGLEQVEGLGTCIIQEYIEGTIPKQLNRQQAIELCQVVGYLHREGIIHRDIKPENILIAKDSGKLYLIDFGLADRFDFAVLKGAAGTSNYAAPEQMEQGAINPLTDIYGIGVVLSQLSSFSWIAKRCMQRNPKRRYQSAEAIIRRLKIRWWKVLFGILCAVGLLGLVFSMNTRDIATNAKLQQQQILLDSLQMDKRNLEIKNRADSLKIDSLSSRIATLQSDMSELQEQTYHLENGYFMNSNNLYPHRYSSDNPNSQR